MLGKLDIHIQKNEAGSYLTLYINLRSKWIKDLNVRPKSIKLLVEKNVGENVFNFGFGSDTILDIIPNAQGTKEKKTHLTSWKLKISVYQKTLSIK